LPASLTRTSICKNYILLPVLDAVNDLIAKSIADGEEEQEETEGEENDHYFSDIPGTTENDEEAEEVEDDQEQEQEDSSDDSDEDEEQNPRAPQYCLLGYTMGCPEFALLTDKLTHAVEGYLVRYELFDGHLFAKTCPSAPYERAVSALIVDIMRWQIDPNNPGRRGDTLMADGSTGKPPVLFRTSY
jgi:hypothetical protein